MGEMLALGKSWSGGSSLHYSYNLSENLKLYQKVKNKSLERLTMLSAGRRT